MIYRTAKKKREDARLKKKKRGTGNWSSYLPGGSFREEKEKKEKKTKIHINPILPPNKRGNTGPGG